MPLLDHFHPPLSERRPWESFHTTWAGALATALNEGGLPPGYLALEQIHAGPAIEIDVGTYDDRGAPECNGGTPTATRTVWLPATAPIVTPAVFPPSATVQIVSTEGGRTLVAAIELVSPANKDRESKRRLFAAKCATYLANGVGLIVIDVVTNRTGNLHNELVNLAGWNPTTALACDSVIYAIAYRPLVRAGNSIIEMWRLPLEVGQRLPTVPLSLEAESCVPVDLEIAYATACRQRRVEEALR